MSDPVQQWLGSVLALTDLHRFGPNLRELVVAEKVVLTPCAREEMRRLGISLVRREPAKQQSLGYDQDGLYPLLISAVLSLAREGYGLQGLELSQGTGSLELGKKAGEKVVKGEVRSAVLFCQQPEAAACAANKLSGIRAAAVSSMHQAKRAMESLGANLIAVEMPGRTYFEIKQMLQLMIQVKACPEINQVILESLDAHS